MGKYNCRLTYRIITNNILEDLNRFLFVIKICNNSRCVWGYCSKTLPVLKGKG